MHAYKALIATAFAAAVSACSYSNRGDGFEMYVYAETSCGTGSGYEQFYGSGDSPACDCYNLSSSMNDNVKSFTYTASNLHAINIYQDAHCQGTILGTSIGNWMDTKLYSVAMHAYKALITTAFAAAVSACSYSNRGDGFEMYVYAETDCGTGSGYEQFYGSGDSLSCDCYNLSSSLNDNVKSFTYTASTRHSINIYKDAHCAGDLLGTSVGNWMDTSVSSAGQAMSSFNICLY
ncbi:hypothetical protein HYDPIDRAFT_41409 [Hydnomerulius pinastri MD-312]|uniref:Unplaced genomic scaffold scaffold_18, whole genome shotgun sequence n=1 Tax=Hydnomerulius pinastri MD-312 TaxID=994086 RepID=A0A0C9VY00_9AGAM|nr:hypothetical protein HYDPIDRAFT_41409 [Hydnomerulius pinastri MD-312]